MTALMRFALWPIAGAGVERRAAGLARVGFRVRLEVADPRGVGLRARLHRACELVVPLRLGVAALLLERAPERVVRVVVGRLELLDDRPELLLRLPPAREPEVRD